jgi:hypothetical protein
VLKHNDGLRISLSIMAVYMPPGLDRRQLTDGSSLLFLGSFSFAEFVKVGMVAAHTMSPTRDASRPAQDCTSSLLLAFFIGSALGITTESEKDCAMRQPQKRNVRNGQTRFNRTWRSLRSVVGDSVKPIPNKYWLATANGLLV